MAESTLDTAAYVNHHLQHLTLNLRALTWGNGGFWTLNLDSLLISTLLGIMFVGFFAIIAQRA